MSIKPQQTRDNDRQYNSIQLTKAAKRLGILSFLGSIALLLASNIILAKFGQTDWELSVQTVFGYIFPLLLAIAARLLAYNLPFKKRTISTVLLSTAMNTFIIVMAVISSILQATSSSDAAVGTAFFIVFVSVPCLVSSAIFAVVPFEKFKILNSFIVRLAATF